MENFDLLKINRVRVRVRAILEPIPNFWPQCNSLNTSGNCFVRKLVTDLITRGHYWKGFVTNTSRNIRSIINPLAEALKELFKVSTQCGRLPGTDLTSLPLTSSENEACGRDTSVASETVTASTASFGVVNRMETAFLPTAEAGDGVWVDDAAVGVVLQCAGGGGESNLWLESRKLEIR